ncbi:hypothetical protein Tco_1248925, partial [Tanacetum coccineum]
MSPIFYVPQKVTVKGRLATLGLFDEDDTSLSSTDLIKSSRVKVKYFSQTWKVLMQYIIKCLGGMQGSHDHLNANQQAIAYCLCWGLDIDITDILVDELSQDYLNLLIPSSEEETEEFVVPADAPKSLEASESAKVEGNQPKTADAEK